MERIRSRNRGQAPRHALNPLDDSRRAKPVFPINVRHNPYIFFAAAYFVLLAVGLSFGFVLGLTFEINIGWVINFASFVGATIAAVSRLSNRWVQVQDNSGAFFWTEVRQRKTRLAAAFAAAALAIDMAFYTVGSYAFTGAFRDIAPFRYVVMAGAYALIAYFVLDHLHRQHRTSRDLGPELIRDYRALSEGDKSVLAAALVHPGAPMLTNKGSANDRFWAQLNRLRLMEEIELPSGLDESGVADQMAAWKITPRGQLAIPELIRQATEQNTRP